MQHHLLSRTAARLLTGPILLFALYVQFHGDFGPGGGFQAGVIFAVAFILYALIYGVDALLDAFPASWQRLGMSLGLLTYIGTGFLCMALGGKFLDYSVLLEWAGGSPQDGQHLGILMIELGVGITVTCSMMKIFVCFSRP